MRGELEGSIYDVRTEDFADREGEGIIKSQISVDVLYGSPLRNERAAAAVIKWPVPSFLQSSSDNIFDRRLNGHLTRPSD